MNFGRIRVSRYLTRQSGRGSPRLTALSQNRWFWRTRLEMARLAEPNVDLLATSLTGAGIASYLPREHHSSLSAPMRLNQTVHFQAPIFVAAISSAHSGCCSPNRESADDLATYGALRELEALFRNASTNAARVRHEERPRVTQILAGAVAGLVEI